MSNKRIFKKTCNGPCRQTLDVSEFDKKSNGQYFGQCKKCRVDNGKKKPGKKNYPLKSVKIDNDLYNTVMKGWNNA